jgi:hypothetical protein
MGCSACGVSCVGGVVAVVVVVVGKHDAAYCLSAGIALLLYLYTDLLQHAAPLCPYSESCVNCCGPPLLPCMLLHAAAQPEHVPTQAFDRRHQQLHLVC